VSRSSRAKISKVPDDESPNLSDASAGRTGEEPGLPLEGWAVFLGYRRFRVRVLSQKAGKMWVKALESGIAAWGYVREGQEMWLSPDDFDQGDE